MTKKCKFAGIEKGEVTFIPPTGGKKSSLPISPRAADFAGRLGLMEGEAILLLINEGGSSKGTVGAIRRDMVLPALAEAEAMVVRAERDHLTREEAREIVAFLET